MEKIKINKTFSVILIIILVIILLFGGVYFYTKNPKGNTNNNNNTNNTNTVVDNKKDETKNNENEIKKVNDKISYKQVESIITFYSEGIELKNYQCEKSDCGPGGGTYDGYTEEIDNNIVIIYDGTIDDENRKIVFFDVNNGVLKTYTGYSKASSLYNSKYIHLMSSDNKKQLIVDYMGNVIKEGKNYKISCYEGCYIKKDSYNIEKDYIITVKDDKYGIEKISSDEVLLDNLYDDISWSDWAVFFDNDKTDNDGEKYYIEKNYVKIKENNKGYLSNLNDKDVVVFISDEREKPFANLERIIKGYDKYIKLKESDTIFISEPSAEGMERRLALIMDEIAMLGVNAISLSSKKHLLHHASSEDLKMLLNLLKPKYLFPVKGEYRNQYAFAEIAEEMNIPKDNILLKQNGDVVAIENGKLLNTREHINVDEILIDGKDSSDIGNLVLKDREMLGENGIVLVSCTLDKESKEVVAGPKVLTRGFIYVKENQDIIEQIKELSKGVIESNIEKGTKRVDYAKIKSDVRDSLGKYLYQEIGSKPMIITVIQEV